MFNLNKEVDEIRLEYYIRSHVEVETRQIELTLSEVAGALNISKSKAQRLVEKFIKLDMLEVQCKSKSKTTKTVYKYLERLNTANGSVGDTKDEIVKPSKIADLTELCDTKTDTDIDTILKKHQKSLNLTTYTKNKIKENCDDIDIELFEHLLVAVATNTNVKNKGGYLIKVFKDFKKNNVRSEEDFFKHTENHKREQKREALSKKWGYSAGYEDEIDFEEIARLSRMR